jgi:M6 family metalloprotease-like protein
MDGSEGAIDWDTFRRPVGTLHAVMLFVDFPDVPATVPADSLYEQLFAQAPAWLAQSSYGKLTLAITPVRHWIRMPEPLSAFKTSNGALMGDPAQRYFADAVAAADPEVDFSGVDLVYIVPPPNASAYPRSSAGVWNPEQAPFADGRSLRAVVTFGSTVYQRGYKVLDHETSHLFGPRDYYSTVAGGTDQFVGFWSLMGEPVPGGDHFAWDKWRMGWLADSQVRCVNGVGSADFVVSPVETRGGVKAVVLRTGLRTAVVAEYRTLVGADASQCSSGVLIYTVNSALAGGAGPIRVADAHPHSARPTASKCGGELDDAAFGRGGQWTDSTSGISISVTYVGSAARIHVVRSKAYVPPVRHPRSLSASVVANPDGTVTVSGVLSATDGFAGCVGHRPVTLQFLKGGEWWTVRTAGADAAGAWAYTWVPTGSGSYRLLAPQYAGLTDECERAASDPVAITATTPPPPPVTT